MSPFARFVLAIDLAIEFGVGVALSHLYGDGAVMLAVFAVGGAALVIKSFEEGRHERLRNTD